MKNLKLTFLLFVLMSMVSNKASAYDFAVKNEDGVTIYYDIIDDNRASVTYMNTNYNSYSGDVKIPQTVTYSSKTRNVTSIGNYAFRNCSGLTSITIPSSVTSIGDYAFRDCSGLTSITIPSSVTSIGSGAFYVCSGLTSITIPSSVTSIASSAFYGCSGLTSITIPNSVTSINGSAFRDCSGLTSITIPSSVTSIGGSAFSGCSGLTSIVVENGNTVYDSRDNCNAIIETSSNTLIAGCKNTVIPSSVTSIASSAFRDCSSLTSITIPSSVTSIGQSAFSGCSGLTSIVVENGNTVYDSRDNCNAIIETSSNTLIAGCKNTVIPSGVTSIGSYAFYGCSGLTSITIPSSVTSIGAYAFYGCKGLTSITIPSSVTSIGSYAFRNCSGLTSITIPSSVTSIGNYAFYGCSGLISISIPSSVTSIGDRAFMGCSGLTSITIPSSVTSIGTYAFSGCSKLDEVTMESSTPATLGDYAFNNTPTSFVIYVPSASVEDYKSQWSAWSDNFFPQGVEAHLDITVEAKNDRSNIHAVIGESNLKYVRSLKVTGTINGYDVMILRDKMPNLYVLDLTDANIVASTYEYYSGCTQTYNNILPSYMFYGQSKVKEIKLPLTITSIGNNAFQNSSIKSVVIPSGVTSIGECAFSNCYNLQSVDFSNSSIQSIGGSAFSNCYNLQSVDFSNSSIQSIGGSAFYWCTALNSVNLTGCNKLTSIGHEAFYWCTALNSVNLTGCNKLTSIGYEAFYNTNVASIRIPQSVQTIGGSAFSSNSSLKDVYVQTVIPRTINSNTFSNAANATLHVPSLSYYNYYWATAWSQFGNIVEDTNPEYFYVDDDLTVEDGRATDDPVDADITATSGIVVQDDDQTFDEVTVSDNGTNSGSLIPGNNTTINIINLNITVTANKWQFLSFPYRVKLTDVVAPGFYVFRRYDGAQRASTGGTGWASLLDGTEYLEPGVGYIFQSSQSGTLGIRTENPDLSWGSGKTNPLSVYTTDNIQHASWNFVGNPLLCYYDIDDLHTTAPLTFWNGSSYVARRPGDDNYQMKPFEAFFLQKPNDVEALVYEKSGRMTYKQAQEHHNNKNNNARAAERSQRYLINLSLVQDGQTTDETRVVYNNTKSMVYEPDCDAAKFMSIDVNMPQLYSLQGNDRMAINERPEGEVQLGFTAAKAGELTLSAERMDTKVLLRDNLTGTTHDLSQGGYTFTTEAGTYEERFTLLLDSEATGVNALNEKGEMSARPKDACYQGDARNEKFFDLQGRRTTDAAQKGVRIVRKNHETRKIVK